MADLAAPLRGHEGFDVVTAVAPYVPPGELRLLPADVQQHEPRLALDGGGDGLDLVRRVVAAAGRLLRPGGWLLVEVGGDQDEALGPALAATGLDPVIPWWDDGGDLRGLASRATGSGTKSRATQTSGPPRHVAGVVANQWDRRTILVHLRVGQGGPRRVCPWAPACPTACDARGPGPPTGGGGPGPQWLGGATPACSCRSSPRG